MKRITYFIEQFDYRFGRKALHVMFFGSLAVAIPSWLFFDKVPASITIISSMTAFVTLIAQLSEANCCGSCQNNCPKGMCCDSSCFSDAFEYNSNHEKEDSL